MESESRMIASFAVTISAAKFLGKNGGGARGGLMNPNKGLPTVQMADTNKQTVSTQSTMGRLAK